MTDEPAAQAHALLERLFALLHDCRALVPQLEAARTDPEPVSRSAPRPSACSTRHRSARSRPGWSAPPRMP